ncbi:hypothetical protein SBRCBS47491_008731 [Sporothrix bragantina]|uniref:Xaa-Pro dipeptidyl-peptidase C-terminal domain-containing protein n=1 Tax=Sporothrix bragantina TaxID=671064 RepID=A0ABP0CR16_9PEZI
MPNAIKEDIHTIDDKSFGYVFEQNATVPLKSSEGLVRCNVYRPKTDEKVPVLVTYGPYGKDTFYGDFHAKSFEEVNPEHRSEHSAWETPDPKFWTAQGYAVVRADERGIGQSPGLLDTMSRGTSEAFFEVVEWAAEQSWSSGKVGLLGISYYAGSQWRVAARKPKGLAAIIPWEGMSDYYRDRCRHGGILSNSFIKFWWNRQVVSNQYGRPADEDLNLSKDIDIEGPKRPKTSMGTIEGNLSEEERAANRRDQTIDNVSSQFRDHEYYASKEYDMGDIEVPLLSVGNWGGILLHLRGNIEGYLHAGSQQKWLRMIVGRHDLPFYYKEEVEIQRSFLDCFLKGHDDRGWTTGKVAPVDLILRKGEVGFNNPVGEKAFPRRTETEWPISRTQYTRYYLTPEQTLTTDESQLPDVQSKLTYKALGTVDAPQLFQFSTPAFEAAETEITGHVVAHLNVSVSQEMRGPTPTDIDLFLTLRHIGASGKEVFYTGTAGDPVPLAKGWLRVSLRKVNTDHPKHRPYLPWREYLSTDVQPVIPGEIYSVDVEVWPTQVVVERGGKLVLEVSSGDTQGCGIFLHNDPTDRAPAKLQGLNHICFGPKYTNYLTLPIIPAK